MQASTLQSCPLRARYPDVGSLLGSLKILGLSILISNQLPASRRPR